MRALHWAYEPPFPGFHWTTFHYLSASHKWSMNIAGMTWKPCNSQLWLCLEKKQTKKNLTSLGFRNKTQPEIHVHKAQNEADVLSTVKVDSLETQGFSLDSDGCDRVSACGLTSWHASYRWRCTPARPRGSPEPQEPADGCPLAGCPGCSRSPWRPCRPPAPWWRPWGCIRTAVAASREKISLVLVFNSPRTH